MIYLKYLIAPITFDFVTRVETYPFPKDAVREAVYNALIHSRWSSGVPIQIENNAMYISNDCSFPTEWNVQSLFELHRSRPLNPSIARTFFRAGYVESWGRGIKKICDNCTNYGCNPPQFVVHSEDFMIVLKSPKQNIQSYIEKTA